MFTPPGPAPPSPPWQPSRSRSRRPSSEWSLVVFDAATGIWNRYDCTTSDSVSRLKTMISYRQGIPPNQQRLVVNGEIMENNVMVAHYTHRFVLLQMIGGIQIFVDCPAKTITLKVRASDSVGQLKRKLAEICDIPSSQQRLFYAEVELEDGVTLCDYNIQNESALALAIIRSSDSSS